MKIAILSDTHDHIDNIKKAVSAIKAQQPDMVLHAGDFVAPLTLPLYADLRPICVFGNNDGDRFRLMNVAAKHHVTMAGDIFTQVIDDLEIVMYHGTEKVIVDALIACQKYDVVVYGHTHEIDARLVGRTTVINPGTVHGFGAKPTFATFDTKTRQTTINEL